jgi:4-hydroxy-tetrahydrodipicolinate synthase
MQKYKKTDAKAYAREHMRGIYAASITPFKDDLSFDEAGYIKNLRHWFDELKVAGLFTCGKQGEYFALSIAERKLCMEITVQEARGKQAVVMSCSDTHLEVVMKLALHAQSIGADYVIVHSPTMHFGAHTDDTLYEYYRYLCEHLSIGIAMWNHPICGYTMSPQLCARIAQLPNIVAIKYSAPRDHYVELTRLAGDQIIVSNPSEEDWLQNIEELNWQLYLCSTPPLLLQSKGDTRMHDYTQLAFSGDFKAAHKIQQSLQPARVAFAAAKVGSGPTPMSKVWQACLGQVGGQVRRPLLNLTPEQAAAVRHQFSLSGIGAK